MKRNHFITAMPLATGTWYALWQRGRGAEDFPRVVDTDHELDALAKRNGIDKVQVVEIVKG